MVLRRLCHAAALVVLDSITPITHRISGTFAHAGSIPIRMLKTMVTGLLCRRIRWYVHVL